MRGNAIVYRYLDIVPTEHFRIAEIHKYVADLVVQMNGRIAQTCGKALLGKRANV